ncbi:MAG: hypothetical protein IJC71_01155 [Clostridia bacterium]|nr:hypothetical protein [Clostridia bacterium]
MKSNHDIHTHNLFSACCRDFRADVPAMIRREEELGVEIFGLSNHIWDERVQGNSGWYGHQTAAHAREAKYAMDAYKGSLKLLYGAETEYAYLTDTLGMSCEGAVQFDYLLVPHSHNHMRGFVMADYPDIVAAKEKLAREIEQKMAVSADAAARMANAAPAQLIDEYAKEFACDREAHIMKHMINSFESLLENKTFIQIAASVPVSIAHPFSPCAASMADRPKVLARFVNEYEARILSLCQKAAKMGVAMEINLSATMENGGPDYGADHPAVRLYKIMKKAGNRFTFGTDSHGLDALEKIHTSDAFTKAAGITEADIADWTCLK